jgi:hypothetical protein
MSVLLSVFIGHSSFVLRPSQRGAFSSFCIPDAELDDPVWRQREGSHRRSDYYHSLQREERRALESHVRQAGCRLIIDPEIRPKTWKLPELISRLNTVAAFLEAMPDGKAEVALSQRGGEGNLTILGDWFVAESQVCRPGGYRQTVFNWHAPSALRCIERFNEQILAIWKEQGIGPRDSRHHAVDRRQETRDLNVTGKRRKGKFDTFWSCLL